MSSSVQENLLGKLQSALDEKPGKAPRAVLGLLNDTDAVPSDGNGPGIVLDALAGWEEEDRLGLLLAASDLRGRLRGLARQLLPLLRKRFWLLTGYPDPVEAEERAEVLVSWLSSKEATQRLGELQEQSRSGQVAQRLCELQEQSDSLPRHEPELMHEVPAKASATRPSLPVDLREGQKERAANEKLGDGPAEEEATTGSPTPAALESLQETDHQLAGDTPNSGPRDRKAEVTETVNSKQRDPSSEKKKAARLRDRWLRMVLTCVLAEGESRAMRRGLYALLDWHANPIQRESGASSRSRRKRPNVDHDLAYVLANQLTGTSTSWAKKFWQLMRPPMESAERYRRQTDRAIEREQMVRDEASSLREKLQQREDDVSRVAEEKRTLQAELGRKSEEIAEAKRDFKAEKTNLSRRSQDALARQATVIQRKLQHEVNEAVLALDDSEPDVAMALRRIQRMHQILAELK